MALNQSAANLEIYDLLLIQINILRYVYVQQVYNLTKTNVKDYFLKIKLFLTVRAYNHLEFRVFNTFQI